jgi:hypothetical protein
VRLPVNFGPCLEAHVLEHQSTLAKVRRIMLLLVTILPFMVSGCCKPFDSSTKQENEAARGWVTGSWEGQYDWTRIARWKSVTGSNSSRAQALLQARAVVQVTSAEAQELVGESSLPDEMAAPYLLRAVGDSQGTIPLELSVRPDGTLWVGWGGNSKCPVPMRRRPVVAWLDKTPGKIYVTFNINPD